MTQPATRDQLIERLKGLRDTINEELTGVTAQDSVKGAVWGLADVVRHISGRVPTFDLIERRVRGEQVTPPPRFDPEVNWRRNVNTALENMDYLISFIQGLKEEDLDLTIGEGENVRTVRSMLEFSVDHYALHAQQIKDVKATGVGQQGE